VLKMPQDNRLPSFESILEFQEVYLRAIALSWTDATFKQALLEDTALALARYFGYKCPWNVKLRVREPAGPEYGWNPTAKAWCLPPSKSSFSIPVAPAVAEQPVAFAAYNDAGPTYLFTCC
jgi:ribosomally synthesized peptide (two-chain TOMM family)